MRKAPEARREVDSKVSEERVRSMHKKDKNNKSEKHGRYIKEIEGEPKEAALDTFGDQKDDPKNSLLLKKLPGKPAPVLVLEMVGPLD